MGDSPTPSNLTIVDQSMKEGQRIKHRCPMLPSPVTVLGLLPGIALSSQLVTALYLGILKNQVIRRCEEKNIAKKRGLFLKSVAHLSITHQQQAFQNFEKY